MASFLGLTRLLLLSIFVSSAFAGGPANGTCTNPRVRREWRQFSEAERTAWITAVNCLADLPHDPRLTPSVDPSISLIPAVNASSSFYDDFVYMHMDLNFVIHFTGFFLPWHRYFTFFFEQSLIDKCGYKGTTPYWDWSIDAANFEASPFFGNTSSDVGGWGDPNNDGQIYTGGFKDEIRAYPTPHHIRRNYTLYPFQNPLIVGAASSGAPPPPTNLMINTTMTKTNVDYSVNNFPGDYIGFQGYMESVNGTHPGAHLILAGDMTGFCPNGAVPPACDPGPKWTPNDPLFFMHHAMIDKIWFDWQNKLPMNKFAYEGGSVAELTNFTLSTIFPNGGPPFLNFSSPVPGDGFWNVTIWDTMDTMAPNLCYTYE